MNYSAEVSIVKTIQVRTISGDYAWNKRYRVPSVAARDYASSKMMERRRLKWNGDELAAYHHQTQADIDFENRLADRYVRYLTMVFKRLIA